MASEDTSRRAAILTVALAAGVASSAQALGTKKRDEEKNSNRGDFEPAYLVADQLEPRMSYAPASPRLPPHRQPKIPPSAHEAGVADYFGLRGPEDLNSEGILGSLRSVQHRFDYTPTNIGAPLNPFHIESLLSSAAQHLDRGLSDVALWQEKASLAANLGLEMLHFARLDSVHRAEEIEGLYDVAPALATSDRASEEISAEASARARDVVGRHLARNLSLDALNKQVVHSQLSAWIGGLPGHEKPHVGGQLSFHGSGMAKKTGADHFRDGAFEAGGPQLVSGRLQWLLQCEQQDAQSLASGARLSAKLVKESWERKDAYFKRHRTQISRDLAQLKFDVSTREGGPLNFVEQMQPIQRRFNRNLSDALVRIDRVRRGLSALYGYSLRPTPALEAALARLRSGKPVEGSAVGLLDDAVNWVRDTQTWVEALLQREQGYVLTFSIRALVGDDAYERGRENGTWSFQLSQEDFPNQRTVRLKGVSCTVSGNDTTHLWLAMLQPPRVSRIQHPIGQWSDLDQSHLTSCRIGRILPRQAQRDPDVVGTSSLYNASPLGMWTLNFSTASRQGRSLTRLDDIYLDLSLGYFAEE